MVCNPVILTLCPPGNGIGVCFGRSFRSPPMDFPKSAIGDMACSVIVLDFNAVMTDIQRTTRPRTLMMIFPIADPARPGRFPSLSFAAPTGIPFTMNSEVFPSCHPNTNVAPSAVADAVPFEKNELFSGFISVFDTIFRNKRPNPSAADTYTGTKASETNVLNQSLSSKSLESFPCPPKK